jgi:hypothetical protein
MTAQVVDMVTFDYFDLTSGTPKYGHQQAFQQGQWIGWATVIAEEMALTYGAAAAIQAGRTAQWALRLSLPRVVQYGYLTADGLIMYGTSLAWVPAGTISGSAIGNALLFGGITVAAMSNGPAGVPHESFTPSGQSHAATYEEGLKKAQEMYPKLSGRIHDHHITPMYLGGPFTGPTISIDAAYHQMITNAFRALWPYGSGRVPTPAELAEIMRKVYSLFPLP